MRGSSYFPILEILGLEVLEIWINKEALQRGQSKSMLIKVFPALWEYWDSLYFWEAKENSYCFGTTN